MADDDLLQSWKEIAAYLERSERTCRRWEAEFGLPTHRMDSSARGSVFAYKSELDKWMDEILHDEKHAPPAETRRASRRLGITITAIAVICAAVIVVVLFRLAQPDQEGMRPSAKPTLAILPFTNNTGDEDLDFWEHALADLLVTDLSQSRYLSVLPQNRVSLALQELGQLDGEPSGLIDLSEIATLTNVENIVAGSFVKAGIRFRIAATVWHVSTGDSVVLPSVEVRNEEEIFFQVDELSARIKNHLVSRTEINDRDLDLDLGKITTSSLEAYRCFVDGRASWRDGHAREAMEAFENAVAIDPEFAMAYNWLAGCYASLPGYEDEAETCRARAFEFSDHASPRERYYIRGQFYLYQGQRSWDLALENFSELVRAYPGDDLGALRLGFLLRMTEQWERCIETLGTIDERQGFPSQSVHLRRAHGALGQYEAALDTARGSDLDTTSVQFRQQLILNLILDRRFDVALLEAERMLESAPGNPDALLIKGDIHFYRNEWDQAEATYRLSLIHI